MIVDGFIKRQRGVNLLSVRRDFDAMAEVVVFGEDQNVTSRRTVLHVAADFVT